MLYEVIGRSMSTGIIERRCGVFDSYSEAYNVAEYMSEENDDMRFSVEDYLG